MDDPEFVEVTPSRSPFSIARVRAIVAAMNPPVSQETQTYDAALVLAASAHLGHNVDRLARVTGVTRERVARWARRLVDNGVWREGNTVGRWLEDSSDVESFWADVAVAEGRRCRRLNQDGEMEWAAQGAWWKQFEYSRPGETRQRLDVSYQVPTLPEPEILVFVPDIEDANIVSDVGPISAEFTLGIASGEPPSWLGPDETVEYATEFAAEDDISTSVLFPDAVWLG